MEQWGIWDVIFARGSQDGLWRRLRDLGWLSQGRGLAGPAAAPCAFPRCFPRGLTQALQQSAWLEQERQQAAAETGGLWRCEEEPLWRRVREAIHTGYAALGIFRVLLGNILSNLPWSHSCSCSQVEAELEVFQAFSDLFSCDPMYLACVVIAGCLIEARRTLKGWQERFSYCMISATKRFLPCTAIHSHSFELWTIFIVVSEVSVRPDTPTEFKNFLYELALRNPWRSHPESSSQWWALSHWSCSTEIRCVRCNATETQFTSSNLKKKLEDLCQICWTHSDLEWPSYICWKFPCFTSSPASNCSWVMVVLFSFNLLKY